MPPEDLDGEAGRLVPRLGLAAALALAHLLAVHGDEAGVGAAVLPLHRHLAEPGGPLQHLGGGLLRHVLQYHHDEVVQGVASVQPQPCLLRN